PGRTGRRRRGGGGRTGHDGSATAGATNTATWALDEIAISVARRIFPRRAITIAPPCSAAFPTMATITTAMKNSERPTLCAKSSSEWTRISLTTAVATVATVSTASDRGRVQAPRSEEHTSELQSLAY